MKIELNKELMIDSQSRYLTQSMFYEHVYSTGPEVQFTLSDKPIHIQKDGRTIYSLKKLFLDLEDPHEWTFADTYLLGWSHWQKMNNNKILKAHFDAWREELAIKMRSKALQQILDLADDGNMNAAKFIAEKKWEQRGAGRPSKQEIEKRISEDRQVNSVFEQDFNRQSKMHG